MAHGPDGAAVGEGLVNGQVEAVRRTLHLRPVERALALVGGDPAACGAAPRRAPRAFLEE